MLPGASIQVGAVVDVVLGIHIGPGFDQGFRRRQLVAVGRHQQGSAPLLITAVQPGTLPQQLLQSAHVIVAGGVVQAVVHSAGLGVGGKAGAQGKQRRGN